MASPLETQCEEALSRFAPLMVSDYHHALTLRTLAWSLERGDEPGAADRYAKEAFLSSTFEIFCAPPDATPEENFVSVKFLLVFFRADDAPPALLDDFPPRKPGAGDPIRGELRGYYDGLLLDLEALGRDPIDFCDALRGMCSAMQIEKRADKRTMSEREFRNLRKHTVAVPAYTECWRTIRGITFSPHLRHELNGSGILDIACELVYLVNDIGSLVRDEKDARSDPSSVDSNFVRLRARLLDNRDAALDEAINQNNQRIADFRRAEQLLCESEHGTDSALHAYLELLRSTVNGNLATTKHLVPFRYEGAMEALSRIHLV